MYPLHFSGRKTEKIPYPNAQKLEKPVLSDSVKVHTEWEQLGKVLMTLNAKSSILVTMLCRFG